MRKRARICTCSLYSSVELEILFQNGRSAFFQSKIGLKQRAELAEIEQKAQPKNIKTATEWGVKKIEKWCEERKFQ